MMKKTVFVFVLLYTGMLQATDINQKVANAYNEGIVRCGTVECASYLYACFRSYSASSINEFLACGSQASRLNNNQFVVAPAEQGASMTPTS